VLDLENAAQSAFEAGQNITARQNVSGASEGANAIGSVSVNLFFCPIDPPDEANAVIEVAVEFAVDLLEPITGGKYFNSQIWSAQKEFVRCDQNFFESGFGYE
jgi:hypothetical protein